MDENLHERKFSLLCRFCIRVGTMNETQDSLKLHSLFDYPESAGAMNIAEIFVATTPQMVINSSDGLPQVICNCCLKKLLDVQKFHQLCKESEQSLLQMKNQNNQIQTIKSQSNTNTYTNASMVADTSLVKEELNIDEEAELLVDISDLRSVEKMDPNSTNCEAMNLEPEICIEQIAEPTPGLTVSRRRRKTDRGIKDFNVLLDAIKAIKVHNISRKGTAKAFNIDMRSLGRYVQKFDAEVPNIRAVADDELLKVVRRIASYSTPSLVFNEDQETVLVEIILKSVQHNNQLSITKLKQLAYEFALKTKVEYPRSWDET